MFLVESRNDDTEEHGMTRTDGVERALRRRLGERVLTAADDGFGEAAGLVFAGAETEPGAEAPPAVLARPRDEAEVAAVIAASVESGLPLAVRGAGHSYARHGAGADGIVLDLRGMSGVAIDAERRIGTAQGGAVAGRYTELAGAHGLATGFGDTGTVGVGGIALGGGIGFLSRRDGLTADQLLGARVVLADGRVVRADDTRHPELFWALRGGGGNFGVVTSLEFRLHATPVVMGGMLVFEPRPETLGALLDAAAAAPDELSAMLNVLSAPPVPFLPAERHGTPVVTALLCWSGAPERGEAAVAPFRAAGVALADFVREQPYSALLGAGHGGSGIIPTIRSGFRESFGGEWAERAIELVRAAPTSGAVVNLRPMGGAIARVPVGATAFAHREQAVMTTIAALDADPARAADGREWLAAVSAGLGVDGDAYVNFLGDAGPDEVRAAYPGATLQRLAAVKRAYDPGNVFRSNHNVPPAAGDPAAADAEGSQGSGESRALAGPSRYS